TVYLLVIDTASTKIRTLSLHDALPIFKLQPSPRLTDARCAPRGPCCRANGSASALPPAPSPAEAGADAHRLLVAAECAADGQRGAIADRTLVAQRERALAALETDADADAVLGADARSARRHVQHRRAHRALAIDATVLVGETLLELGLVGRETVAPGVEALVGVGIGRAHRLGGGGLELGHVDRIGGLGARRHIGDLAFVARAA